MITSKRTFKSCIGVKKYLVNKLGKDFYVHSCSTGLIIVYIQDGRLMDYHIRCPGVYYMEDKLVDDFIEFYKSSNIDLTGL